MFNKDKALQQLKKLFNASPVRVATATVLSIEKEAYTIQFENSSLIVSGVQPMVMGKDQTRLIAQPRIGSTVLVGATSEPVSPDALSIQWVADPESMLLIAGELVVEVKNDQLTMHSPTGQIPLTSDVLTRLADSRP